MDKAMKSWWRILLVGLMLSDVVVSVERSNIARRRLCRFLK